MNETGIEVGRLCAVFLQSQFALCDCVFLPSSHLTGFSLRDSHKTA